MPAALPAPKKYSHADADTLHNTVQVHTRRRSHRTSARTNLTDRSRQHKSHYFELEILTDDAWGFIKFAGRHPPHQSSTRARDAFGVFVCYFGVGCVLACCIHRLFCCCPHALRKICDAMQHILGKLQHAYACMCCMSPHPCTCAGSIHILLARITSLGWVGKTIHTSSHRVGCSDEQREGGGNIWPAKCVSVPHLV